MCMGISMDVSPRNIFEGSLQRGSAKRRDFSPEKSLPGEMCSEGIRVDNNESAHHDRNNGRLFYPVDIDFALNMRLLDCVYGSAMQADFSGD